MFLINAHNIITIKFDELACFEWLNIENHEIKLIKFQEIIIWRDKFINSLTNIIIILYFDDVCSSLIIILCVYYNICYPTVIKKAFK